MITPREKVLFTAAFDPKWKVYHLLKVLLGLVASIIGILVVPFWVLGLGQWYCRRYFERLECVLCERSLVIGRGIYFRVEKTIPLDKIQDMTLIEGPLLKTFGLCQLKVETAGQSAAQSGGSEANLIGIVEARQLRDRVLDQRDAVTGIGAGEPRAERRQAAGAEADLLTAIRDSLQRIEALVSRGLDER